MVKRSHPPKSAPLKRDVDLPLVSRPITPPDPRQGRIPFDLMPERIEPCLALLAQKAPAGDQWQYEIKWDGYRLAIHVELNGIRIITRGGHTWTDRFPHIAAAARSFSPRTLILDGEAVVLDEQGRSDFSALQKALGGRGGKRSAGEAVFIAFDLLYLDGHDLTKFGQHERRQMLEDLLADRDGAIKFSETIEADGEELLKQACALGLEGIIAKHDDRPYRSGRTGDWLKIKCVQSDSFVIVGYEPSTSMPGAIARLLLAAMKDGKLVYVGSVGTGFKHAQARDLKSLLDGMKTDRPAIAKKGKTLVFVRPEFTAEIEYRGWTDDAKLRHASFKGLRDKVDAKSIFTLEGPSASE
ncbi:non-homologous end-joining DNA ligase [Rhizobium sp. TH2]|uniref:non-homologous end-joining DNA ligase n=1 Tax=Rhizobium sp. TH2 TaxID=2775403 RepID=UPI0021573F71|nr:non-homologous end-joining DNA ligase [Rhizobium sp. TH2]UVC09840.1 non-homologous end-joining DNA ligase [Rhizobium sp. TH2]